MEEPQQQIYALLEERGLDPAAQQVTLMRHAGSDYPLHRYLGTRALTLYQARQQLEHPVGSLILGFYGHRAKSAVLLGVWRVMKVMDVQEAHRAGHLDGGFESLAPGDAGYFHHLEETDLLQDLRLKLEVHWGRELSWRRILKRNDHYPVTVSLEPAVRFIGLSDVSLIMSELRMAMDDPVWQNALGNTCGIYLITDERTGRQYVGSAYGGDGIWQRWSHYASTGHGDNLELKRLLELSPGSESDLRFTLLEPLLLGTPKAHAIARENFWKVALGSRRFGMNLN